jgi:hypothetical protein
MKLDDFLKQELKTGDRVRVYGPVRILRGEMLSPNTRHDGKITNSASEKYPDCVVVQLDHPEWNDREGEYCIAHRKQLRKLVKKERRRIWISEHALQAVSDSRGGEGMVHASLKKAVTDDVEFVEVRRKK